MSLICFSTSILTMSRACTSTTIKASIVIVAPALRLPRTRSTSSRICSVHVPENCFSCPILMASSASSVHRRHETTCTAWPGQFSTQALRTSFG
uniref:Putative secreted protein n=1 Tax=Anopheles darlingi TaxID=43151 RepID=A0A2M4D6E7_ANODA